MVWKPVSSISLALILTVATPIAAQAQSLIPATISTTGSGGDILRVRIGTNRVIVYLACVDAPESNQPTGQEASARLKQLLPVGTQVQLRVVNRTSNVSAVAEVFKDGQSINLQMVRDGAAVISPWHLVHCQNNQKQYTQAQSQAQSTRKGFWSQNNPLMPWEWRRKMRTPSQSPGIRAE